jgi:hypothetical protein
VEQDACLNDGVAGEESGNDGIGRVKRADVCSDWRPPVHGCPRAGVGKKIQTEALEDSSGWAVRFDFHCTPPIRLRADSSAFEVKGQERFGIIPESSAHA